MILIIYIKIYIKQKNIVKHKRKEQKKMKKELTKEQNTIINDLLFSEFIKMCQLKGEAEKK